MERNTCPACGSRGFNGSRCRNCYFEFFTEEIAHNMHTHKGEPLVLKTAPTPRKANNGCKSFPGKRKRWNIVWIVAAIYLVFSVIVPIVMTADFSFSEFGYAEREPEPAPEPFIGETVLYDDGDILITANWEDGNIPDDKIEIQVDNRTNRDITVITERVSVNGYMTDDCFYYCMTPAETVAVENLWLPEMDLNDIGLETIEEISFRLNIYDSDNYETLAYSEQITFHAAVPEGFTQNVDDSGTEVYSQDGIRIVYQGLHGEDLDSGSFRFYAENTSAQCMSIYAEEILVNGESAPLVCWCDLMPGTRAVFDVDLFMLEEEGFETLEDIHALELRFGVLDSDTWETYASTDWISIDIS